MGSEDFFGFRPCRDDKCPRQGVHPAHDDSPSGRQKNVITECPDCGSALVTLKHKRALCSRCSWSGSILQEPPEQETPILEKLRQKKGDHA
jgi:hypothetical protein